MKSTNKITLKEAAEIAGGILKGSSSAEITGANTIEFAKEGDITFFANPRYRKYLEHTRATCILIPPETELKGEASYIITEDPSDSFRKVLGAIYGSRPCPFSGVSRLASVDGEAVLEKGVSVGDFVRIEAGARVGPGTVIYPGCYIGRGVETGSECVLYPNVTLMEDIRLGSRVIVNPGAVIGGEGFGFVSGKDGHKKIPQVGSVIVHDDVEIGSNVSIDRGSPGDTVIGEGTKIDNLVQIAHNVRVGRRCLIVSQAGIAGSTVVEDGAVLAGQAGVVGHITIGAGAQVGAQAGVTRDVKPGQQVSGYPAMNHSSARRINALIRRLPDLFKQVEKLKRESSGRVE